MKTKNLSFEDFQEKKISKNGLKSIFGGDPNNGPGGELVLTEDELEGNPPTGGTGTGITAGGGKENMFP